MWTCDIIAGLNLLEKTIGSPFCLSSIRAVKGTPIILFETTGGNTFAYNHSTGLLENKSTTI